MVHFRPMEAVYPNLKRIVLLRLTHLQLLSLYAPQLLAAPYLLLRPRLKQLPRSQAHRLPQVLQRLLYLHALLLHDVVLDVLQLYQHFLRVDLPLFHLVVSILLYSL